METHTSPVTERFVRDLMPNATDEEIGEAICNLQEYFRAVMEIADRLEQEGKEVVNHETYLCDECLPEALMKARLLS